MARFDSRDGNWYTKPQFVEFYGGDEEWNRALLTPAVTASADTNTSAGPVGDVDTEVTEAVTGPTPEEGDQEEESGDGGSVELQ